MSDQAWQWSTADLPYLTADLSGIGGVMKSQPADFIVEEIPAYSPCGSGEHLFLWVEKQGVSAEGLVRHVSRSCGVSQRDIGVAAMKDRQAVTRQFLSIPVRYQGEVSKIEYSTSDSYIRVLDVCRHENKLRTGHLKGNRFSILLRGVCEADASRAMQIAERLRSDGVPNYFGDQRFGRQGQTAQLGLDLLRGICNPRDLPASQRRFLLKLALSAGQSVLFNQVVSDRIQDGLLKTVLLGDVMQVVASGGIFVCEDSVVDQVRFHSREIVTTGPIFGRKMRQPSGLTLDREQRVVQQFQLQAEDFDRYPDLTQGTRRPLLIYPEELELRTEIDGLRFEFRLPSGCYATVLLREFQKQHCPSSGGPSLRSDDSETVE